MQSNPFAESDLALVNPNRGKSARNNAAQRAIDDDGEIVARITGFRAISSGPELDLEASPERTVDEQRGGR